MKLNNNKITIDNVREHIVGITKQVTLLDGSKRQYVFFDNAASTPSFSDVKEAVNEALEWYSAIHRGAGIKSLISTKAYDDAHEIVEKFVNANPSKDTVIFGKNTTEAVNKLANRLELTKQDVVLVSGMEHHSNDLPWRKYATVKFIDINEDGTLNLEDLEYKALKYRTNLKVIAITGAANVTGIVNPYYEIAEIAHKYGAWFVLDAAQLAPHRKIDMKDHDDPQHIDFLVMSAHKMYAPFGTGVLVGNNSVFKKGDPDFVGGGTVSVVTHDEVHWAHLPDKEEAGTPNYLGAVAFAKALKILDEIGMDKVAEHEVELTNYMLKKMKAIPQIKLLGKTEFENPYDKLGVITFNVDGFQDGLVAAILCYEGGIGLRNGCFCAHPYVKHLLKVTKEDSDKLVKDLISGNRSNLPGAIRVSFGCYNTIEEIDYFTEIIQKVIKKEYRGNYICNEKTGIFSPENFEINYPDYFDLF